MAHRIALVTGSSRGIGASTARRLAVDGADVVVHYRQDSAGAEATRQAVSAAGVDSWVFQANLATRSGCERLWDQVVRDGPGSIDVLVNNAGIYPRSSFLDITPEQVDQVWSTNTASAFHCAQLALPGMIDAGWGRIVNLSSILGQKGTNHGAHYAASKAAVIGLTKALALEFAGRGVTVNAVAPGAIETDILAQDTADVRRRREAAIPMGRIGRPEEVADAVAYLCGEQAGYVTGLVLSVNGGLYLP